MTSHDPHKAIAWRGAAGIGYTVILLTFGVLGGWAATAQIDRAVVAPGIVMHEHNRKIIQHLEGGIVREVLVREGDIVKQGAVLVQFDTTQPQANLDLLRHQYFDAQALEARLQAERDNDQQVVWPAILTDQRHLPEVRRAMEDQGIQFNERRISLKGQIDILESRIQQLGAQIDGIAIEKNSSEAQVNFINEELQGLRQLREKGLIPVTRVLAMERERTRLEGQIGRAITDTAKARSAIGETRLQIQQEKQKMREGISAQLLETRKLISELREKMTVNEDILKRVDILAPKDGAVHNIKVFNAGQVIRPGEQLMEIAPKGEDLIIQARFSPAEIDGVYPGQPTEIRFEAFQMMNPPIMTGALISLSRDRLVDEGTRQPYYLGQVSLSSASIPATFRERIRAGMSADVITLFGARTFVEYLIAPMQRTMRKAFIQH